MCVGVCVHDLCVCVMPHICMSHESCRKYQRVSSHIFPEPQINGSLFSERGTK